jgi:hypothetical protein
LPNLTSADSNEIPKMEKSVVCQKKLPNSVSNCHLA